VYFVLPRPHSFAAQEGHGRSFRFFLRLLQQDRYVGPQFRARRALLGRQFRQRLLVTDARQIAVALPVGQDARQAAAADLALGEQPRQGRQLGAQPAQRLPPQGQTLRAAEPSMPSIFD
jgi:hypothetical protein